MELAVVRALLESEDIVFQIKDELSIQINPFYSNALGGIKLYVQEKDLEKTLHLLSETNHQEINTNED